MAIEEDPVERIVDMAIDSIFANLEAAIKTTMLNAQSVALVEIREQFAGTSIHIGKGTAARRMQRNAAIRTDHTNGVSIADLTRRYFLSEATLQRILKEKL